MTTPIASRVRAPEILGTNVSDKTNLTDVLRAAGLDWTITDKPADSLYINDGHDLVSTSIPDRKLLIREDTNTTLGIVGAHYQPLSNRQAFKLADEAQELGAQYAFAGELDHGRKTFIMMDIPEATITVGGHDVVEFSVLFQTDNTGNGGMKGQILGNRQVCTNGQIVGSSFASWSIRHSRKAGHYISQARQSMSNAFIAAQEFADEADTLLDTRVTDKQAQEIFTKVLNIREDAPPRQLEIQQDRLDEMMYLFREADTQSEGRNTGWGVLQAVLEWEQYYRPARGGELGRARRNFINFNSARLGRRVLALFA